MIKKRILFLSLIMGILGYTLICPSFGEANVHSKSYQIILINNYYSGIFMETANIDTKNQTIEINYLPWSPSEVTNIELNVGEIIGFYKDIKIIQTNVIENIDLKPKQNYITKIFSLKEFEKGMFVVLWVGNLIPSYNNFTPLTKDQLLERAKAIRWEQDRLTNVFSDMGTEELKKEVTRNFEP